MLYTALRNMINLSVYISHYCDTFSDETAMGSSLGRSRSKHGRKSRPTGTRFVLFSWRQTQILIYSHCHISTSRGGQRHFSCRTKT